MGTFGRGLGSFADVFGFLSTKAKKYAGRIIGVGCGVLVGGLALRQHDARRLISISIAGTGLCAVIAVTREAAGHPRRGPQGATTSEEERQQAGEAVQASAPGHSSSASLQPVICMLLSAPLMQQSSGINGQLEPVPALDLISERERLEASLREAGRDLRLHVRFATSDGLSTELTKHRPRILHFSGHGVKDALILEAEQVGKAYRLEFDKLHELIRAGGQTPLQLVFLAACHSEAAADAFLKAGVPSVIAVDTASEVADPAAMAFTRAFYLAIALEYSVHDAFEKGKAAVISCSALRSTNYDVREIEAAKFKLLPRDNPCHAKVLFPGLELANWQAEPPWLSAPPTSAMARLSPPPDHFVGRHACIYEVVRAVINNRLVTLTGEAGVGKVVVATEAARYLAERMEFSVVCLQSDDASMLAAVKANLAERRGNGKALLVIHAMKMDISDATLRETIGHIEEIHGHIEVHLLVTQRKRIGWSERMVEKEVSLKGLTRMSMHARAHVRAPARIAHTHSHMHAHAQH